MKTVGVMQPYLFPYLGYFQLMNAVDEYVIYDDAQYIKGGWINRNNILIGKQKSMFTINIQGASSNKLINQIDIQDSFAKFLKSVSMAYSRAPYHTEVMQLINSICSYEDKNLARFIGNSFRDIAQYIEINTVFLYSSHLKIETHLRAQAKIIAICKALGADQYYNAIGGIDLYDRETFKDNGVRLMFLRSSEYRYRQFSKTEFTPDLSIIDVMMFNPPDRIKEFLNDYELI
jgi:hypothetical protein